MPKGPTEKRSITRRRLLDSAMDAFAERGYYGASIEDICERAGFTRGAFYSNFGSKDELFYALFEEHTDLILTRLRDALALAMADQHPLARFIEAVNSRADDEEERRWYLVTTEFTLYAIREPRAAETLAAYDARLRDELATVFAELLAATGREPVIDAVLLARMAIAVREGAGAQAYVERTATGPKLLERLLVPTLLEAFSRPAQEASHN
ncbi:TetR/AcrR family transcriptional regulator [Gordonia rhizosphera]|uniref:Putative TetR family transcriptional regulator n=1 Tax=Gordonia rhizosphera NBRC 16068 TaxID=1108045 RepID=K6WJA6_9ACTN|nr:TetR/AcrR family transcriptional regulator [Gordonia rhizosphera]GAB92247.1 putative TetR family transcriptional regulator [Gordonia rhizosphera NBRC 16068]